MSNYPPKKSCHIATSKRIQQKSTHTYVCSCIMLSSICSWSNNLLMGESFNAGNLWCDVYYTSYLLHKCISICLFPLCYFLVTKCISNRTPGRISNLREPTIIIIKMSFLFLFVLLLLSKLKMPRKFQKKWGRMVPDFQILPPIIQTKYYVLN